MTAVNFWEIDGTMSEVLSFKSNGFFVNSHPLQGFEGYCECSLQSCPCCTRSNPSVLFK